ncbi:hypothetical protein QCD79_30865, partial [Pseudomonas quasicaspiana]|nr:hypothetical protein [Pseudomonas quasicaspiana]
MPDSPHTPLGNKLPPTRNALPGRSELVREAPCLIHRVKPLGNKLPPTRNALPGRSELVREASCLIHRVKPLGN